MGEKTLPKLLVNTGDARKKINAQIEKGEKLREQKINSTEELKQAKRDCRNWSKSNKDTLLELFGPSSIVRNYNVFACCTAISSDFSTPFLAKEVMEQSRTWTDSISKRKHKGYL